MYVCKKCDPDLLGDHPVPILVHVLEELLQSCLLAHELFKAQSPIKVAIHPRKEICDLLPAMLKSFFCCSITWMVATGEHSMEVK